MSMNRLIRRIEEASDAGVTKFKGKEGFWRTQNDGDKVFLPTEKYGAPSGANSGESSTAKSKSKKIDLEDMNAHTLNKMFKEYKGLDVNIKKDRDDMAKIIDLNSDPEVVQDMIFRKEIEPYQANNEHERYKKAAQQLASVDPSQEKKLKRILNAKNPNYKMVGSELHYDD